MVSVPYINIDTSGLAPIGEGVRDLWGLRNLLHKICGPAADELGELLCDKVRDYRSKNIEDVLSKSRILYDMHGYDGTAAHPRIVHKIIEESSWIDDSLLQDMWSGLLVSSCSLQPNSDNVMFIDILSKLTHSQAKVINFAFNKTKISLNEDGLLHPMSDVITSDLEELRRIYLSEDVCKIDRELDHLRSIGLIYEGINLPLVLAPNQKGTVDLTLTPLCIQLCILCAGFKNPIEFQVSRIAPL